MLAPWGEWHGAQHRFGGARRWNVRGPHDVLGAVGVVRNEARAGRGRGRCRRAAGLWLLRAGAVSARAAAGPAGGLVDRQPAARLAPCPPGLLRRPHRRLRPGLDAPRRAASLAGGGAPARGAARPGLRRALSGPGAAARRAGRPVRAGAWGGGRRRQPDPGDLPCHRRTRPLHLACLPFIAADRAPRAPRLAPPLRTAAYLG
jgi:hypothetical protein